MPHRPQSWRAVAGSQRCDRLGSRIQIAQKRSAL